MDSAAKFLEQYPRPEELLPEDSAIGVSQKSKFPDLA